jgi:hypothetical protein
MTPSQTNQLERLGKAVERMGTHTLADLFLSVKEGKVQLWSEGGLLLATEVITYPRLKSLRYIAVGGEMIDSRSLQNRVDTWGREQGCTRAETIGRKGWERAHLHASADWTRWGGFWLKDL